MSLPANKFAVSENFFLKDEKKVKGVVIEFITRILLSFFSAPRNTLGERL